MTTETTEKNRPVPMPVGGAVTAIVPQSFEEIQRVANTVITGGLAPAALIKWPKDSDSEETVRDLGRRNIAAVAGVLMAGAELGVPPMAALRMFTSINGRPALYADGNVAVVRRARDRDGNLICAYITQGYERGTDDASTFAWCEAKRADNDEVHREEFSIEDAKRAGLWETEAMVDREVWEGPSGQRRKVTKKAPNDAPWYRYPKRMMMWRATGYCLRWLFADVLAGMVDEFEAREIEGMVDITPSFPPPPKATRTMPPPPPTDDEIDAPETTGDATTEINGATGAAESATQAQPPVDEKQEPFTGPQDMHVGSEEWFGSLIWWAESAGDQAGLDEVWHDMEVNAELVEGTDARARADAIYAEHTARLNRKAATEAGQTAMFDDLPEETKAAIKNGNTP